MPLWPGYGTHSFISRMNPPQYDPNEPTLDMPDDFELITKDDLTSPSDDDFELVDPYPAPDQRISTKSLSRSLSGRSRTTSTKAPQPSSSGDDDKYGRPDISRFTKVTSPIRTPLPRLFPPPKPLSPPKTPNSSPKVSIGFNSPQGISSPRGIEEMLECLRLNDQCAPPPSPARPAPLASPSHPPPDPEPFFRQETRDTARATVRATVRQNAKWEREIALEYARWMAGRWECDDDEPRSRGKCSPAAPPVAKASEADEEEEEEGGKESGRVPVMRGGNAEWLGRRMMR